MPHKLNKLKLLTDENIQPELVAFLRKKQFDVFDIKEQNFNGSSDNFILNIANSFKTIISQNFIINFPFIITVENNLQKIKIRIRELDFT